MLKNAKRRFINIVPLNDLKCSRSVACFNYKSKRFFHFNPNSPRTRIKGQAKTIVCVSPCGFPAKWLNAAFGNVGRLCARAQKAQKGEGVVPRITGGKGQFASHVHWFDGERLAKSELECFQIAGKGPGHVVDRTNRRGRGNTIHPEAIMNHAAAAACCPSPTPKRFFPFTL